MNMSQNLHVVNIICKNGEIIFSTPNDTAENKAQQAKEEVEQGELLLR